MRAALIALMSLALLGALFLLFALMLAAWALDNGAAPPLPPDVDLSGTEETRPDDPGEVFSGPAADRMMLIGNDVRVTERDVERDTAALPNDRRWRAYEWEFESRTVAMIAPGTDRRHHFVNGFLVGYVPHANVRPWIPLVTMAQNKRYQTDEELYGADEIWQTSRQAHYYPSGDCEDHALAVADWLIGLGYDARVALGTADGEGHAWVVLLDGERTYLLEATDKNVRYSLPLIENFPEYHPQAMFNRDNFWVNTGSPMTTDYRGRQWEIRGRYRNDGRVPEAQQPEAARPRNKNSG